MTPRQEHKRRVKSRKRLEGFARPFAVGVFLAENPNRQPHVERMPNESRLCDGCKRYIEVSFPARDSRDRVNPRMERHAYLIKRLPR